MFISRVGNPSGINVCGYNDINLLDSSLFETSSTRGLPWAEGSATTSSWILTKDLTAPNIINDLKQLEKTNSELYNKIMSDVHYDLYHINGIANLSDIQCLTGKIAPDFGGVGMYTQRKIITKLD